MHVGISLAIGEFGLASKTNLFIEKATMTNLSNPSHIIPGDVASCLQQVDDVEVSYASQLQEVVKQSRPTEDERSRLTEILLKEASTRGITPDMSQKVRDIQTSRFNRLRSALQFRGSAKMRVPDDTGDTPEPSDSTFWWANSQFYATSRRGPSPDKGSFSSFSGKFDKDGLHVYGGVTTHDGDLYFDNFGIVALFELQSNRIPGSPSGRWISSPYIETYGALLGNTGDGDIFSGDLWSKCWIHLDQQIFQVGLGQNGPAPIILGQGHDTEKLIDEEDKGRTVNVPLRGFQFMPQVIISDIRPAASIWARLEIRFDIQTEGAGSILYLNPEVLIRTFQWRLNSL